MSGMHETPPADLDQALIDLEADAPAPSAFERVARWRRACGDAESAAEWQTWSLLPPEQADLRTALAECWRRLGRFEQAARLLNAQAPSWHQLILVLQQHDVPEALGLQSQLLQDPPPLEIEHLLELVSVWRDHNQPEPALELLQRLAAHQGGGPSRFPSPLANACADLLEQLHRYDEAASWWEHSLRLDPWQNWPMMRLAHHSLRQHHPAICVHYCRTVLERDPQHRWAPGVLHQGLEQLGARQSLLLLSDPSVTVAPAPACDGWSEANILDLRCVGLFAMEAPLGLDVLMETWLQTHEPHQSLELWLIASPEPLWLRAAVDQQLRTLDCQRRINVKEWPRWDANRWPSLSLLLLPPQCPTPHQDAAIQVWRPQPIPTL